MILYTGPIKLLRCEFHYILDIVKLLKLLFLEVPSIRQKFIFRFVWDIFESHVGGPKQFSNIVVNICFFIITLAQNVALYSGFNGWSIIIYYLKKLMIYGAKHKIHGCCFSRQFFAT